MSAVGVYTIALTVQHPLPGLEDYAPSVFVCANNIEVIIMGRCVGVVLT